LFQDPFPPMNAMKVVKKAIAIEKDITDKPAIEKHITDKTVLSLRDLIKNHITDTPTAIRIVEGGL
jgi:hypothetical protein